MTPLRGSGEKSFSEKAFHLPVNFVKHATLHVAPERSVRLSVALRSPPSYNRVCTNLKLRHLHFLFWPFLSFPRW